MYRPCCASSTRSLRPCADTTFHWKPLERKIVEATFVTSKIYLNTDPEPAPSSDDNLSSLEGAGSGTKS